MKIAKQKGTRDIFLEDAKIWQYIEKNVRELASSYHMSEIRTPVFEATELYARGVGDETDIVNKEMYTFLDKGGRSITLRPELTAGVVRAYIENGLDSMPSPLKLWYIGNMYRYEKMQKGRYREFTQFGVEILGSDSNLADIETICLAYHLFKKLDLTDQVELSINSIGCQTCRNEYIEALKTYVKPHLNEMCETCQKRYEKNPLRMIDCKEEHCKGILADAPMITDHLCEACQNDFNYLQKGLEEFDIPYIVDKTIVRGLDYYNKTVFEFTAKELGFAACGGGRYDTLVETLGGKHVPAVGFGMGLDRIFLLVKEYHAKEAITDDLDIYFAILDKTAHKTVAPIIFALRDQGYQVDLDISDKSFKAMLKYADKQKAKLVCIIGEEELNSQTAIMKNMQTGEQVTVALQTEAMVTVLKAL